MRLIDADALKEQHEAICKGCEHYNYMRCASCNMNTAIAQLENAPTIGGWISVKEVRQALKVLYSFCYSKRQNTNPVAYVSRCDVSFVDLMDDEVTGGFGKWMYANGVNSAITGIRMYIEDMLRTLDELEDEPAQEVTED